jgi:serine/threonine protein kinase
VLIYELLHGETPFANCRTETELKQQVNIPINPKQFRPELTPEIREVIALCLEIEESKRVTPLDLECHLFFKRLL